MGFAPPDIVAEQGEKAKVLAAASPEMDERLHQCLPGHQVHFVRTMREAVSALRHDGFRLLVIDLGFDESRMFELLQHVRALPHYKDVPVICVYGDHLNLSEALIRNIDVAVKALGGMAFLDLRDDSFAYQADCHQLGAMAAHAGGGLPPPN
jgi:CheY-like chemotaxis protein